MVAFGLAMCAVAVAAILPGVGQGDPHALPPNVLIVLTDDQTFDTLPSTVGPAAMPAAAERSWQTRCPGSNRR